MKTITLITIILTLYCTSFTQNTCSKLESEHITYIVSSDSSKINVSVKKGVFIDVYKKDNTRINCIYELMKTENKTFIILIRYEILTEEYDSFLYYIPSDCYTIKVSESYPDIKSKRFNKMMKIAFDNSNKKAVKLINSY